MDTKLQRACTMSAAPNPFDDPPDAHHPNDARSPAPSNKPSLSSLPPPPPPSSSAGWTKLSAGVKLGTVDKRARRRREEAVSRLVADATRPPDFLLEGGSSGLAGGGGGNDDYSSNGVGGGGGGGGNNYWRDEEYSNHALESAKLEARLRSRQHSTLLLASTVASSIERGLDKELHAELVWQGKEAQGVIGRICHDHSEDFLESVGKVVAALGGPCEEVKSSLEEVSEPFGGFCEWIAAPWRKKYRCSRSLMPHFSASSFFLSRFSVDPGSSPRHRENAFCSPRTASTSSTNKSNNNNHAQKGQPRTPGEHRSQHAGLGGTPRAIPPLRRPRADAVLHGPRLPPRGRAPREGEEAGGARPASGGDRRRGGGEGLPIGPTGEPHPGRGRGRDTSGARWDGRAAGGGRWRRRRRRRRDDGRAAAPPRWRGRRAVVGGRGRRRPAPRGHAVRPTGDADASQDRERGAHGGAAGAQSMVPGPAIGGGRGQVRPRRPPAVRVLGEYITRVINRSLLVLAWIFVFNTWSVGKLLLTLALLSCLRSP